MEQESRRFKARSDRGKEFTVIEYQSIHEHKDLSGKISTTKGLGRFALNDGSTVVQIDSETFKIIQTDEIIRKV